MTWLKGALVIPDRARLRVGVAADQGLVAESVRAALGTLGYRVQPLDWPLPEPRVGSRTPNPPSVEGVMDVALLLSELDHVERVRASRWLLTRFDVPWLVLTGVREGPAWGAMYEGGANLVVPTSICLSDVARLIDGLSVGQVMPDERGAPEDLIGVWRRFKSSRVERASRIRTLTGRENEVLRQLCLGFAVRDIAGRSEVSEATVRSQVKAILRKLGVNSQIAAVAAYQELEVAQTGRPVGQAGR